MPRFNFRLSKGGTPVMSMDLPVVYSAEEATRMFLHLRERGYSVKVDDGSFSYRYEQGEGLVKDRPLGG